MDLLNWFGNKVVRSVEEVVNSFETIAIELEDVVQHHEDSITKIEDKIYNLVSEKEAALKEQFRASSIAAKIRSIIN